MNWRAVTNRLLSALFEPPCATCSRMVTSPLDGAVCGDCWSAVRPFAPPVCDRCGDPLPSWRVSSLSEHQCPRCRQAAQTIDSLRAVGAYDGRLRDIVHALKYGGRRSIAPRLGALMRASGSELLAGADAVVPVPLHPRRERSRGFNQADDLARALGLPVRGLLRRVVATAPQVDLPATDRHRNVRDAFRLAGSSLVDCRVIVLVDDVATTGATLEACARVLKAAGARDVRAITAARVVTGRP